MSLFEGKNMQAQYNVLSYWIDFYYHDYQLAIEINENGHIDRNINCKTKSQKAIEQKLCCEFIKIYPDKEDFGIFQVINEKFRHIRESTRKTLKNIACL